MRFWPRRFATPVPSRSPEEVLASLPDRFRATLLSMYGGELQIGSNGELYKLDSISRIDPNEGMWLYDLCRRLKPKQTAEIGLAYGFSTVYFLAAIHDNGTGSHIAIDPFPERYYDVGLRQPEKLDMTRSFIFINKRSFPALVQLAQENQRFEVIFIDGNHRFDDVLVDFTLSAELCAVGGHIVLDDMWMPSVRRVASFIRTNRSDFSEVPTSVSNIAEFKRVGDDMRDWRYHVEF